MSHVLFLSSLNEIECCVFRDCSSLEKICIPSSVQKIGYSAFSGCRSLKQIEIEPNIKFIDSYAFFGCSMLKQTTIPFVASIEFKAFPDNTKIIRNE